MNLGRRRTKSPFPTPGETIWGSAGPLLVLLACKPSKRATRRWLVERLRAFAPTEIPNDEVRRTLMRWITELQRQQIVEPVLSDDGQLVAVQLAKKLPFRRQLWYRLAGMATRATTEPTPTLTAQAIANVTGKNISMVWRWFRGAYVPKPEALARLWLHYGSLSPESVKADMRKQYGDEAPIAFSFLTALQANELWTVEFLLRCGVTPAELKRARDWVMREQRPIFDFVAALLARENPKLYKALGRQIAGGG